MEGNVYIILFISIIIVVTFFLSIITLWLYQYLQRFISIKFENEIKKTLNDLFQDSANKRKDDVQKLRQLIKNRSKRIELLIDILSNYKEEFITEKHEIFLHIYKEVYITEFLTKKLNSKNKYDVSRACRHIGNLKITGTEAYLLSLLENEDNDIIYNVLLSLSSLGDEAGIVNILTNYSSKLNLSYRTIIEIFSYYRGDKAVLSKKILDSCDDYIRSIIIKAAAKYKFEDMKEYYEKYIMSEDKNLRIACIRALSELGDKAYEENLIKLLFDDAWEVRAAAAKGLESIGTEESFRHLAKSLTDSEWWVRHNSAKALVSIDGGKTFAIGLMNEEDKYASDAIKYALDTVENKDFVQ